MSDAYGIIETCYCRELLMYFLLWLIVTMLRVPHVVGAVVAALSHGYRGVEAVGTVATVAGTGVLLITVTLLTLGFAGTGGMRSTVLPSWMESQPIAVLPSVLGATAPTMVSDARST